MRAGLIIAAVLLLAACAGAPSPTAMPPGPTPTEPPAADDVRLLASDLWGEHPDGPFSVDAATNQSDYDELWARVGQQIPQPEVDFGREMVLFLGTAGSSSCPERFERLVVDGTSRVYAEWSRPMDRPCTDDLAQQGVLLAVARAVLPQEPFQLSLREQPICADCPTHPDQLIVDPR
jgi:hypothetical protein